MYSGLINQLITKSQLGDLHSKHSAAIIKNNRVYSIGYNYKINNIKDILNTLVEGCSNPSLCKQFLLNLYYNKYCIKCYQR